MEISFRKKFREISFRYQLTKTASGRAYACRVFFNHAKSVSNISDKLVHFLIGCSAINLQVILGMYGTILLVFLILFTSLYRNEHRLSLRNERVCVFLRRKNDQTRIVQVL